MRKYLIKEYKVYTLDYYVEANSKEEALGIFHKGTSAAKPDLDSLSFVEVTNSYGTPIEEVEE